MTPLPPSHPVTPLERLSDRDLGEILLKREDRQPTGSHKDRAARFQVDCAIARGMRAVVISSSGNAGIAAAHYCRHANLPCFVFLALSTPPGKIIGILDEGGVAILSDKPVNYARFAARVFGLPNLRPSMDPDAITGFMSLGVELAGQLPEGFAGPLLMFSTSGASLTGLARGIASQANQARCNPRYYAVQSGRAHTLASRFDARPFDPIDRLAGQGGLPETALAEELAGLIAQSTGGALYVTDTEILAAHRFQNSWSLSVSHETDAAIAALARLRHTDDSPACIVATGASRPDIALPSEHSRLITVHDYSGVRSVIERFLETSS